MWCTASVQLEYRIHVSYVPVILTFRLALEEKRPKLEEVMRVVVTVGGQGAKAMKTAAERVLGCWGE